MGKLVVAAFGVVLMTWGRLAPWGQGHAASPGGAAASGHVASAAPGSAAPAWHMTSVGHAGSLGHTASAGPAGPAGHTAFVGPVVPAGHIATTHVGVGGVNPHPLNDLSARIGEHVYYCLGKGLCKPKQGFIGNEFNLDTIAMTIIAMAIVVVLALIVRRSLSVERPRGVQNVLEFAFEFINGFVADSLGSARTESIGPLAVALFLFILISNYLDLIPIPAVTAPTGDLNTTVALALITFVTVQVLGIRARHGGGYVKHFFEPFPYLFPINVIEEVAKPVTLAFRLFGNIFAGDVLILVFGSLLAGFLPALIPAHAFAIGLGLFVGAIQAFIFSVLTVAYIGISTSTEGH